jgi:GntR family transcriptional regulator
VSPQKDPLSGFKIDYGSGLPVWIQMKNRLAYLIGTGSYAAGDKLPTVRALAIDLDISYNTVNRAYMDLEREGYITTRKGRGTFVAERPGQGSASTTKQHLELVIDDMINACAQDGLMNDEIIAMVKARLERR